MISEMPFDNPKFIFSSRMLFNTVASKLSEDVKPDARIPLTDEAIFAAKIKANKQGQHFSLKMLSGVNNRPSDGIIMDYQTENSRLSLGYGIDPRLRDVEVDDFALVPSYFRFPVVLVKLEDSNRGIQSPYGTLPTHGVKDRQGQGYFVRDLIFSDSRMSMRYEQVLKWDELEDDDDDFIRLDRLVFRSDSRYVMLEDPDFEAIQQEMKLLQEGQYTLI